MMAKEVRSTILHGLHLPWPIHILVENGESKDEIKEI